jgi:ABC-type Fe3+ transport system permease subunit
MIEQIRKIGWLAAEAGLLLIVLCILLNILLGKDSGPFIGSVAENASKLLGGLPPGVTLGVGLILLLYWFVKSRLI